MFKNWFKSEEKEERNFVLFLLSDDSSVSTLVQNTLTQQGCTVYSGITVAEAVKSLDERGLPDVLIVDLYNPEVDGTAFIQQSRHRFGRSKMPPILFLMDSPEDEITAEMVEANDLLQKPFEPETLLQCVKTLVERAQPASTE